MDLTMYASFDPCWNSRNARACTLLVVLLCLVRPSLSAQTIYLSEDFSAGSLPSGWTVFNQQSPCIGWEFGDSLESAGFPIPPHGMYAAVNDNRYDNAAGTANLANWCYLYSPIIDCSVADSLRLEFDYFIPPDIDGRANVALSNGGIYNYFFSINEQNGWNRFRWNIPRAYYTANFRFRIGFSDNGASANGLAIDHVVLSDPGQFDLGIVRPYFGTVVPVSGARTGMKLRNNGLDTITDFRLDVTVDGTPAFSESFGGLSLLYARDFDCMPATRLPSLGPGRQRIGFALRAVNGQPLDENPSNDTASFVVEVAPNVPDRRPVLIDKTGAWCTYCADGSMQLDSAVVWNPEAIGVAIHGGDMMDSSSSSVFTGTVFTNALMNGGYPKLSCDAYKFPELPTLTTEPYNYGTLLAERLVSYEPVGVKLEGIQWDVTHRTVSATVVVEAYDTITADLRPNLWLLADEVYGLGTGWDQVNAANTQVGHPFYGLGDPIIGFRHKHVLLSMRGGAWGTPGVLPATLLPGTQYRQTYSLAVPEEYWGSSGQINTIDSASISLVGLVQQYSANSFDRRILQADAGKLTDLLTGTGSPNASPMFLVGPSPARDYLTVRSLRGTIARVFLFDLAGRPVFSAASGEGSLRINTTELAAGSYILLVQGSDQQAMQYRVVIE
ncbi:MAG TPA: T9SS type A sorting domain-containing protein [Bacteroidia bacterium]|jgi:hypothetical protein|nr:T9SS type A sorting domain-containing protein [Bacteroidia bacterium]